ncbi:methionine ABC transporter ATP-binding protein [Caviibacter abscessus]|uniref:methionine ABC transporter ATP-binding protein n=1 Tax=Caviibacter abscessus TaxID=1766719 RepID=UPI00082F65FB|nr:ATP-binding cassette domain-containing protein [Caviibacter abscessus]
MIEILNLKKSYENKEVLKDINLHIKKGEIFGIVGLSGAGKSTLIRMINRLEIPDSGKILVNGQDILKFSNAEIINYRKKTSMIFQHFNLLSSRTVMQNVLLPLELSREVDYKKVEEVLKLVELYDKKDSYINKLSGGQKQRVAIARALITNPSIILSDESTSSLDPIIASNILDLLKKINKELGITIILITHQMEVIKKMCDKIAVLKNGEIIESGETKDIFLKPKHEFTRSLIGSLTEENDIQKTWILHFLGTDANKSYITEASKLFGININILGGNIYTLSKGEKVGYLKVQFEAENTDEIVSWFKQNMIEVEVLYG